MDAAVELPLLAKRLKVAGEVGVRREMVRALREAGKPLIPAARESAQARLPKAGGLAERVAGSRMSVSVRTTGRSPRVRVQAQDIKEGSHDVRATNAGYVRHPVFGHRDRWVRQEIPQAKDWWVDAMRSKTPEAQAAIETVLVAVAAQVNGLGI